MLRRIRLQTMILEKIKGTEICLAMGQGCPERCVQVVFFL
jgi:hypothetical protein